MGIAPSELGLPVIAETLNLPSPNYVEIPFHLKRSVIKKIRFEEGKDLERLWADRGVKVEERVKSILEKEIQIVQNVEMHKKYAPLSDMSVYFVKDFPIDRVKVEVKSSWMGIQEYKEKIRRKLPSEEKTDEGVKKWLTKNKIVLVNGSEYKSPKEILNESFYPQLQRIIYFHTEERSA